MATYFSDAEVKGLNRDLVVMLVNTREVAGIPILITSGLRTCSANQAAMGVEGSAHLKGLAVDMACEESISRYKLLKALLLAGFNRIGIYSKHLHADIDKDKPQNVIWWGVSH
jgi:uncharacterized protein YcbK (DUF882 family)